MIEDAVEDDAHPGRMRPVDQREGQLVRLRPDPGRRIKRILAGRQCAVADRVGTEVRIDVVKTRAVVFVRGRRGEDRVQVKCVNPEILEVGQLVDDPLQVAAVAAALEMFPELLFAVLSFVRLQLVPVAAPRMNLPSLRGINRVGPKQILDARIVGRITVAETLGEDLVPDHRLRPPRNKLGRLGVARRSGRGSACDTHGEGETEKCLQERGIGNNCHDNRARRRGLSQPAGRYQHDTEPRPRNAIT